MKRIDLIRLGILMTITVMGAIAATAQNDATTSYDNFDKMKTDHWTIYARGFYSIGNIGGKLIGDYIDENGNIVGMAGTSTGAYR